MQQRRSGSCCVRERSRYVALTGVCGTTLRRFEDSTGCLKKGKKNKPLSQISSSQRGCLTERCAP